jgi:hypothetical protein
MGPSISMSCVLARERADGAFSFPALNLFVALSTIIVGGRSLHHETASNLNPSGANCYPGQCFPMCDESKVIFVVKEILISYNTVNPQPRIVVINCVNVFLGESQNAVCPATPFEGKILVCIEYKARSNSICVDRREGQIGITRFYLFVGRHTTQCRILSFESECDRCWQDE